IKGDLAVARRDRAAADPDDGAGGEERVEVALVGGGDARGEDAHLEVRRGDERALELRDRVEQGRLAGARRLDAVPGEREARERDLLDGLDLFAQSRERALPQRSQHAGVDPLHAARARPELAFEHGAGDGELAERATDECRTDAQTPRELDGRERAVRA